jgi:signal transduction histidine kinase
MRVLKENTENYQTFFSYLKGLETASKKSKLSEIKTTELEKIINTPLWNIAEFTENITSFIDELKSFSTIKDVYSVLNRKLKAMSSIKRGEIFLFNNQWESTARSEKEFFSENQGDELVPLNARVEQPILNFIKRVCTVDNLNRIFEEGENLSFPVSIKTNSNITKNNFVILPVIDSSGKRGIFLIISESDVLQTVDINFIKLLLYLSFEYINLLSKQNELKSVYNELQVYQSKLSNDFRLSAIGEFTTGLTEDLLSRLQLIISNTEFLRRKGNKNNSQLNAIDKQVREIEVVIRRLIKFSEVDNSEANVFPVNINEQIKSFYELASSSLKSENYECILELEENIPSVLTQPDCINQLLTNVFSFIKQYKSRSGGILIESKHHSQNVTVRILTTDYIEALQNNENKSYEDLNLRIIRSIMNKHDGSFRISSSLQTGTVILLTFPLGGSVER